MGGATKRSFISTYFLLSAYFLTAQSYKRMRLTTRVYGIKLHYEFYAYTTYMFRQKGSDASWKDDNEVPPQVKLFLVS